MSDKEKATASHSSTLAWKIPWTEEPGRLQSMGSLRVGHFRLSFHFHALEKAVATHSRVPAWRIPGTAEPGGLPSMGSHRVGHDWSDLAQCQLLNVRTGCSWTCSSNLLRTLKPKHQCKEVISLIYTEMLSQISVTQYLWQNSFQRSCLTYTVISTKNQHFTKG